MKILRSVVGLVVVLLLWQLASRSGNVLVPPLEEITVQFAALARAGLIQNDIVASVLRVLAGVIISTLIACLFGLIAVFWQSFSDYITGVVELLRPVPPIAWTPVAIIAFGIGAKPAIAIVAIGSIFPIWLGILQGLREVQESHVLAAGSLGAGKFLLFTDVILPSLMPYFMHGVRVGVGIAWFCVIAAEMVGASSGLGYGIQLFSLNIEMSKVYCYLITIGVLGLLSNAALQSVFTRATRWQENG